ncbi:MAG: hypothetical protein QXG00_06450 [Candidatus Woesearchaeota archaeon]
MIQDIEGFFDWMENEKGLSQRTMKEYRYYTKQILYEEKLNQETIRRLFNRFPNGVCRAYVKNLIHYLKSNPQICEKAGLDINEVRAIEIPQITGRKKIKKFNLLSEEDIHEIASKIENKKFKLMWFISYYAGLRVGELMSITNRSLLEDIRKWAQDKNKMGQLSVKGKGGREGVGIIPPELMEKLYLWFKEKGIREGELDKKVWGVCRERWRDVIYKYSEDIVGFKVNTHLLRHCLKEDCEILTLEGWKKYTEIKEQDEIFSYNLEKDILEIKPIDKIYIYNFDGELNCIKNRYLDYSCTDEHKGVFKIAHSNQKDFKRYTFWEKWKLISFKELSEMKNIRLIKHRISGIYNGKLSIGKEKAGILGWILTDGHINYFNNHKEITISQSLDANRNKVEYLENLFKNGNIPYTKTIKSHIGRYSKGKPSFLVNFQILKGGNHSSNPEKMGKNHDWIWEWIEKDRTPKWKLLNLKNEELQELWKGMMMGDGTSRKGGYLCNEFCNQNPKRIEFFRILSCLLGKRTLRGIKKQNGKEYSRIYITEKDNCELYPKQIQKEKYKGKIWCISNENETFIVKSNEKIFITGNSRATDLFNKGANILVVKEFLRHKDISSTQIYLHLSREKLMNDIEGL